MKDQTIQRPSRARRLTGLVALAIVLPALSVWVWGQQADGDRPQREPAKQAADKQPTQHKHTNHLVNQTSPYLLQHAHNPVDWYPWGEQAFKKAKREDKPIFLSVGYSTCYWCHVMEKESFEDEQVAKILNEHYVAIKVDREERPDVDKQYMLATQLMTRRGGWPNSVWLTPEGKPWMAGTYLPKPQFIAALKRLAEIWDQQRKQVDQQADQMAQAIARISAGGVQADGQPLSMELVDQVATQLAQRYDQRHGGFGPVPKFPPHGTLAVLIQHHRQTRNDAMPKPITHTLDAMWLGGMHDHVGGGFHRYSTDQHWLLPHFEKMLYDNAQLMRHYVDGYKLAGHERYRRAVADIFRWVEREMTSPRGAFYSAIDSGEVGKEGETYVWHIDELREVLGEADAKLFAELYNFDKAGNFTEEATGERPGTNIPHLQKPIRAIAQQRAEDPEAFATRIDQMRDKLLARRQTWVQPHKDDKVLTSWNGLMIGALAYAGRQLDEPRYTQAAARAADFILDTLVRDDGTLLRTYRAGQAKQPGYLDDYAYFARGLLELHRATGDRRWLKHADRLGAVMVRDFQDKSAGGFFFTTKNHDGLLARSKHLSGGGNIPNANGVATQALLALADATDNPTYREAVKKTLQSMTGRMAQQPFGSEALLVAASQFLTDPPRPQNATDAAAQDEPPAPVAGKESDPDVSKRVEPITIDVHASRLSVEPGESIELAVALTIDDGWHLYGLNPDIEFLMPAAVSVEAGDALTIGQVKRPEPHRMVDPILKKQLNTYSDRIWFRIPVTVKPDASAESVSLTVKVKTQACDDSRCLPPQTTTLRLPLQVGSGV